MLEQLGQSEPVTLYRGWKAEQLKLDWGLTLEKGSRQMSQEKGRKSLLTYLSVPQFPL